MVPDHADQARGLIVTAVALTDFRSYPREEVALAPDLTMIVGPNGAGKTNLLEGVHVATQGFSPRTRREVRLVRFGAEACRVRAWGARPSGRPFETEVTIRLSGPKRIVLDGAPLTRADGLRSTLPVLAFTPDRLAVVKGGPIVRRAYADRALGRVFPARADLPFEYAAALAQRNAALRRVRHGTSSAAALAPWNEAVVRLGAALDEARAETVRALAPAAAESAAALGLPALELAYEGREVTAAALEASLGRDLERGTTGVGPHLRDVGIAAGGRELRSFGSQGEQRLAVLAILLAEARLLGETRGDTPLLLLDDVLSELDDSRRAALLEGVPGGCQTLVTATSVRSLPPGTEPGAVVEVSPGRARAS